MARRRIPGVLLLAAAALLSSASRPALATELQVASGPGAGSSSWSGDGALSQSLKLGLRFAKLVSIDALGRLGYASVDQRMLTYVSLGGAIHGRLGIARPYARLALVHQHRSP